MTFNPLEVVEKVGGGVFYLIHFASEIWSWSGERSAGVTRGVSGARVTKPACSAHEGRTWLANILHLFIYH